MTKIQSRGKRCLLEATSSEVDVVEELVEYMAYCCATRGKREMTVIGNLVAVNFLHEQWVERPPPLSHLLIKVVKEDIKKAHTGRGS